MNGTLATADVSVDGVTSSLSSFARHETRAVVCQTLASCYDD